MGGDGTAGSLFALILTKPNRLELEELDADTAPPREGEIHVRMEYSSVQPLDSEELRGELGLPIPRIMGSEGVGTVVASKNANFPVGMRVGFVLDRFGEDAGCWRTVAVVRPSKAFVIEVPIDTAPQEVAAGLTSSLVALACLRHFDPRAIVVVPGACGAVGLALMQLAALRGMRAVGLVRGAERCAWLTKELGAAGGPKARGGAVSFVDLNAPDWHELAASLCDCHPDGTGGADGVIDGLGADLIVRAAERLVCTRGTLVSYGTLLGPPNQAELDAAMQSRNIRMVREDSQGLAGFVDGARQLQATLAMAGGGQYRTFPWEVISWHDAADALVPQPPWSKKATQFKENRIGRILLKFPT